MNFITIKHNERPIKQMHEHALNKCDEVLASVAYIDNAQLRNDRFIDSCNKSKTPLKLYARFDYSIPVGIEVLKWFLNKKSPAYSCHLVSNLLHSKVIWYRPFGIYIGSANLTQRAWDNNFEAGIFLTQLEAEANNVLNEIQEYFSLVDYYSRELTSEILKPIIEYHKEHSKRIKQSQDEFKSKNIIPELHYIDAPQNSITSKRNKRNHFLKEWSNSLQFVRDIGDRVAESYCPKWIQEEVPRGVLADQFLHAYYYAKVRDGNIAKRHLDFHEINKKDKESSLVSAMEWWAKLPESICDVERHIFDWSPKLRENLASDRILDLSPKDFVCTMKMIHSFSEYARQTSEFEKGKYNQSERTAMLAEKVFNEENIKGMNVLELFDYVLYKGDKANIPDRIYEVCFDKEMKFPYIGLSTIGEIVGWALPDDFPPRNGRTSKALFALGYDVKIHTE